MCGCAEPTRQKPPLSLGKEMQMQMRRPAGANRGSWPLERRCHCTDKAAHAICIYLPCPCSLLTDGSTTDHAPPPQTTVSDLRILIARMVSQPNDWGIMRFVPHQSTKIIMQNLKEAARESGEEEGEIYEKVLDAIRRIILAS